MAEVTHAVAALRQLRADQLDAATDSAARDEVATAALAAALGLFATTQSENAEELATVERVLADLETGAPAQAVLLLSLVLARHLLGADEDAARAVGQAWRETNERGGEERAVKLGGAARLLALIATWSDGEARYARRLGELELRLRSTDEPEAALAEAVACLCAVCGLAEPGGDDALARAFEGVLLLAEA